jgi:hypothetical protein
MPQILRASEAVIVTRVDDRQQALALLALAPGVRTPAEWVALLADLAIDEALLVSGPSSQAGPWSAFGAAILHLERRTDSDVRGTLVPLVADRYGGRGM